MDVDITWLWDFECFDLWRCSYVSERNFILIFSQIVLSIYLTKVGKILICKLSYSTKSKVINNWLNHPLTTYEAYAGVRMQRNINVPSKYKKLTLCHRVQRGSWWVRTASSTPHIGSESTVGKSAAYRTVSNEN